MSKVIFAMFSWVVCPSCKDRVPQNRKTPERKRKYLNFLPCPFFLPLEFEPKLEGGGGEGRVQRNIRDVFAGRLPFVQRLTAAKSTTRRLLQSPGILFRENIVPSGSLHDVPADRKNRKTSVRKPSTQNRPKTDHVLTGYSGHSMTQRPIVPASLQPASRPPWGCLPDVKKWLQRSVLSRFAERNFHRCFFLIFWSAGTCWTLPLGTTIPQIRKTKNCCKTKHERKVEFLLKDATFLKGNNQCKLPCRIRWVCALGVWRDVSLFFSMNLGR